MSGSLEAVGERLPDRRLCPAASADRLGPAARQKIAILGEHATMRSTSRLLNAAEIARSPRSSPWPAPYPCHPAKVGNPSCQNRLSRDDNMSAIASRPAAHLGAVWPSRTDGREAVRYLNRSFDHLFVLGRSTAQMCGQPGATRLASCCHPGESRFHGRNGSRLSPG